MKPCLAFMASLLVFATQAISAPVVFFDDFEDEVVPGAPAIGAGNIGNRWGEPNGTVYEVRSNPNIVGNTSSQALFSDPPDGQSPRNANGYLLNSVFFNGATISLDFYLTSLGNANNDINIRLMANNRLGNFSGFNGLNFQKDGDVAGQGAVFNTTNNPAVGIDLNHFGVGVWQNATWTYSNLDPIAGTVDTTLTITRLTDNAMVTGTARSTFNLENWTGFEEFTVINPSFDGNAAFEAYVDNVRVQGEQWYLVPEPGFAALSGLAAAGLLIFRRRV